MYCVWQVVKTPTIISNNPVLYSRTGHKWQYSARALNAGYLRLETAYTLKMCITYSFPLRQWLHECTSVLRYRYIFCFVEIITLFACMKLNLIQRKFDLI